MGRYTGGADKIVRGGQENIVCWAARNIEEEASADFDVGSFTPLELDHPAQDLARPGKTKAFGLDNVGKRREVRRVLQIGRDGEADGHWARVGEKNERVDREVSA